MYAFFLFTIDRTIYVIREQMYVRAHARASHLRNYCAET